jgi:hypothetical protein
VPLSTSIILIQNRTKRIEAKEEHQPPIDETSQTNGLSDDEFDEAEYEAMTRAGETGQCLVTGIWARVSPQFDGPPVEHSQHEEWQIGDQQPEF